MKAPTGYSSCQTPRLLFRPLAGGGETPPWTEIDVPTQPAALTLGRDGVSAFLRTDTAPLAGKKSRVDNNTLLTTEPVDVDGRLRLLVIARRARTWLNGGPGATTLLLDEQDRLWCDSMELIFAVHYRPYRGPAPDGQPRPDCPVCLAPIEAGDCIYLCPGCRTALHAGDPQPGGGALECAQTRTTCPACHKAILDRPGFLFNPEDEDE
jgi:hypothetical protein